MIFISLVDLKIQQRQRDLLDSPSLINMKGKVFNHAGKAKLSDTYQALQNASLFIGHDSVVSHLASETLTPSNSHQSWNCKTF